MTGFGRFESEENGHRIGVEIKAVNHRYLDLSIKMPKRFNAFESQIRGVIKEYAARGKVDVYIQYEDLGEAPVTIRYNRAVAAEYMNYFREMGEEFSLENDIRVSTLARCPDVFSQEDSVQDEEQVWEELERAVRGAAKVFQESREREGEALKADLIEKLDGMKAAVAQIEERSPVLVEEYRKKLYDKLAEVLADTQIDESRILTEAMLYADKICVDEETVRLKTHIDAVKKELENGGSVGRKLDFLAQEMNREANTTLSKTTDIALTDTAIGIKTEIEKIREQVQNIE
jgi:uncharacterized protein (TIGR00255 family)